MHVFGGIDGGLAAFYAFTCIVVGALLFFGLGPAYGPYIIGLAVAAAAIAAGTRYRLRVSGEGVEWTELAAWVFPVKRLRYLLDADIDYYESLEATRPEGLCVRRPWLVHGEVDSPCFGPSRQPAMTSLYESIRAAIRQARELAPATPGELRCGLLAPHLGKLDLGNATRNVQGRIRLLSVRETFRMGQLEIPAGSTLELNGDDYIDPRRDDCLRAATMQSRIRLPMGLEVDAGTRIGITAQGGVHSVRGALGPLELDGFPVDGNSTIVFDEAGRVRMFTLGRDLEMGGWTMGAGTQFSRWLDGGWHCRLSRALKLPEFELRKDDAVTFDAKSGRLDWIHPGRPIELAGSKLYGPLRVRANGRIRKY